MVYQANQNSIIELCKNTIFSIISLLTNKMDKKMKGTNWTENYCYMENLPEDIINLIFSQTQYPMIIPLSMTSKTLKINVEAFINHQWIHFQSSYKTCSKFLARSLSEQEKSLSKLDQIEIIKKIFKQKDSLGRTPIIKATLQSKTMRSALNAVRTLIDMGIDPDERIENGFSARYYANYWSIPEVNKIFLKDRSFSYNDHPK